MREIIVYDSLRAPNRGHASSAAYNLRTERDEKTSPRRATRLPKPQLFAAALSSSLIPSTTPDANDPFSLSASPLPSISPLILSQMPLIAPQTPP